MVVFDLEQEVDELSPTEELKGNLKRQNDEDKLMHSVMGSDKKSHDHAELLQEASNRNIGAFTPDMLYSQFVKNFSITRQILGDKLIRLLAGYDARYIEKNLKIPEFLKQVKESITQTINDMKEEELLDEEGVVSARGAELSSVILVEELDKFIAKDKMGDKINKKTAHYGEKAGHRPYRSGDRYKDLNLKRTVHTAIKRQHKKLQAEDLITSEREGRGRVSLIFALDASASMKGGKIEMCKKAGVSLAYKAIVDKDEVGLIVFGSEVKTAIAPTRDFNLLLNSISSITATRQTDFSGMISKSIELFPPGNHTKHLIILTDALPTVGDEPERDTMHAVSAARSADITISLVGVKLDKTGEELARRITTIGEGRFSQVKDLSNVGHIVLEDYYSVR